MKLFSSFRPEVEEIKNQDSTWEEKLTRYAEKHSFTFYPPQLRAVSSMLSRDASLVAAEVGSGKTLLASVFLALRTSRKSTSVIVAPKGVHPQWQCELERFTGRRAISVDRPESLAAGVNLINVEAFRSDCAFNRPVDLIIADEGHFLAAVSAQAKGFMSACEGIPLRLLLSATPVPNHVEQLFLEMGFLSHPRWISGETHSNFNYTCDEMLRFAKDFGFSDGRVGVASPEACRELLKPYLVSLAKSECRSDLPPLKLRFVPCSIPASAMQSWEKCFKKGALSNIETDFLTSGLRVRGKISVAWKRICHALREGKQIMIVSVRTEPLEALSALLTKHSISASKIFNGQSTEYSEAATLFSTGVNPVMLMGMKSAQSYNFPNCSNVIIIGTDFTYSMFHQALGRCHRLTSQEEVRVDVLYYPGTNEAHGLETIMAKAAQSAVLLGDRDYVLDARIPDDVKIVEDRFLEECIERNSPVDEIRTPVGISIDSQHEL